jgi:hypothetical protein
MVNFRLVFVDKDALSRGMGWYLSLHYILSALSLTSPKNILNQVNCVVYTLLPYDLILW